MMNDAFPPNSGVPELPPPLPTWPKVVGIISIGWGSLGIVCGGCGMIMPMIATGAMKGSGQELPPAMMPQGPQMVLMAVGLLLAVLLIVAGVATLNRKASGFAMHLGYALVSIPLTLLSLYFSWKQQGELAAWAAANPQNPMALQMSNPGQQMGQVVGMVFGGVLGLGYPVFCLIWFGLVKKVRDMGAIDPATDPYQPIA
jgi:hypothetical protein